MMLATLVTGCDDRAGLCPNDLPTFCGVAPSWATQVSPVFARTCGTCHGPGGVEAARPFVTWNDVSARQTSVLTQIYGCAMPLPDAGVSLTMAERGVVLEWLTCGAPNN